MIISLIFCLSLVAPGYAQNELVVPANHKIEGLSQEDWSRAWWQWAGSFEREKSPIADQTGELCNSKQSSDVWFLAGTYGSHRTIRTCTIPHGTYLFFPLINYVVMPPLDSEVNCAGVIANAASMTDEPVSLLLNLDGTRVGNLVTYRQATRECFDMGALAEPKVSIFPSAANGFYVMLYPLAPGRHVLNFGGGLSDMLQAVTYTLNVE